MTGHEESEIRRALEPTESEVRSVVESAFHADSGRRSRRLVAPAALVAVAAVIGIASVGVWRFGSDRSAVPSPAPTAQGRRLENIGQVVLLRADEHGSYAATGGNRLGDERRRPGFRILILKGESK